MNDDELREKLAAANKLRKPPKLRVFSGEKRSSSAPAGWGLVMSAKGEPEPCLHNACVLLSQAHEWGRRRMLSLDEFSGRILVDRTTRVLEKDKLEVAKWLQRTYNWRFSVKVASTAIDSVAYGNPFDALTEHVMKDKWDGVGRVDAFAETYLGAAPTVHHRAAGRVLLLSMAARALKPGCKVDTMVILEGAQGIRKSTAVQVLGGPFFSELLATAGTKESAEQVEGAWVMEVGELSSMDKAELSAAKQFMSRLSDRFRRAYKESVEDVLRRCIMVGTTNASTYLRDETGGRRWLPILCKWVLVDELRRDRDQLVAEAVHRVQAGEPWWLVEAGEVTAAREAVDERFEEDAWHDKVASYIHGRESTSVDDVLGNCLGMDLAHRNQPTANRVARILVVLGWVKGRRKNAKTGREERCYRPLTT
jgi:predicted P-loop ATPase